MSDASLPTSPTLSTASPSSCSSSRCFTPSSVASSEAISPGQFCIGKEFDSIGGDCGLPSPGFGDQPKSTSRRYSRSRRTSFYAYQLTGLGQVFEKEQYPDPAQRQKIAEALDLDFDTVTRWFQNRRAKFRRDSIISASRRQRRASSSAASDVARQTKGSGRLSSFNMETILRKSPSPTSRACFSSRAEDHMTSPPAQAGVNSYYQHFPYYYPAYVYHYYPNVQAHCHSPVSMATEEPVLLTPDKPLDLSSSKKREIVDRDNDVPVPKKKKKRRARKKREQAPTAGGELDLIHGGDTPIVKSEVDPYPQEMNHALYSKFNPSYSYGYYRPYPFSAMYPPTERNFAHPPEEGYVPMTSVPVHALPNITAVLPQQH